MKVDLPELNSPYEMIKATKRVISIYVVTNLKNSANTQNINNSSRFIWTPKTKKAKGRPPFTLPDVDGTRENKIYNKQIKLWQTLAIKIYVAG